MSWMTGVMSYNSNGEGIKYSFTRVIIAFSSIIRLRDLNSRPENKIFENKTSRPGFPSAYYKLLESAESEFHQVKIC